MMRKRFEIFEVETGAVVEGGFFTREAAEDYAWKEYHREAAKDIYGVRREVKR